MTNNPWGRLAEDSGAAIDTATDDVQRDPFDELRDRVWAVVDECEEPDVIMDVLVITLGVVIYTNAPSVDAPTVETRKSAVKKVGSELHRLFRHLDKKRAEREENNHHG